MKAILHLLVSPPCGLSINPHSSVSSPLSLHPSSPLSGHTVLLEADVDIAAILATHGFAPTNHALPRERGERSVFANSNEAATQREAQEGVIGRDGEAALIGREGEEVAGGEPSAAVPTQALRGGGGAGGSEAPLREQKDLQAVEGQKMGDRTEDGSGRGEGD
ncbi:unnamed protein product, partial [Closterium sp. NIES-65]